MDSPTFSTAIMRAVFGRCPKCGKGKLYARYLKPVEQCTACGERYGHIRADDGPAWLTILVVGHILAPLLILTGRDSSWPDWALALFWPALALVLSLLILPGAKGFFIVLQWRTRRH